MPQPAPKRRHVFISYSHADRIWVDRLQRMMVPLLRAAGQELRLWDDSQIETGRPWRPAIEAALAEAKVALLLVSDAFLASEFVINEELPALLAAAKAEGVPILWASVGPCHVEVTEIYHYQAVLSPSRHLNAMNEVELAEALKTISLAIRKAALAGLKPVLPEAVPPPSAPDVPRTSGSGLSGAGASGPGSSGPAEAVGTPAAQAVASGRSALEGAVAPPGPGATDLPAPGSAAPEVAAEPVPPPPAAQGNRAPLPAAPGGPAGPSTPAAVAPATAPLEPAGQAPGALKPLAVLREESARVGRRGGGWEMERQRETDQRAARAAERQQRQREQQRAASERQRLLDARAERRRPLTNNVIGLLRASWGGLQGSLSRRQVLVAGAGLPLAGIATSQLVQRLGQPAAHRQERPSTTPRTRHPATPRTRPPANLQGPQPLRLSQGWLEGEAKGWPLRRRPIEVQAYSEILATGVALRLIAIRGGDFIMGSPAHEAERQDYEGPQHRVKLEGFLLGQTPITQAQWLQVASWPPAGRALNADPSRFKGADRPVERVSWEEAIEFCRRLSRDTGRSYTLPSEAQWEYACRAGSTTPFAFGETLATELANYNGRDSDPDGRGSYANGPKGFNRGQTTSVGMFPPNAWGLQDMHGNVLEWCLDSWHDNYEGSPADGTAWVSGGDQELRLLRGGSWFSYPRYCRSAYRFQLRHDYSNFGVGFRVVCLPQGPSLNA